METYKIALTNQRMQRILGQILTCDLLLIGEPCPGTLLLFLQGLLLGAQVLHKADGRQGALPPVKVGRQRILLDLGDSCTGGKRQNDSVLARDANLQSSKRLLSKLKSKMVTKILLPQFSSS